jgi:hypothetical protein
VYLTHSMKIVDLLTIDDLIKMDLPIVNFILAVS